MCCCSFKHIISLTFKYLLSQSSTGRTFFPNNDCSASNTSAKSSISDTGRKLGPSDHSVLPWLWALNHQFVQPIATTLTHPLPPLGQFHEIVCQSWSASCLSVRVASEQWNEAVPSEKGKKEERRKLLLKIEHLVTCLVTMAYIYAAYAVHVTIFSTDGKFWLVSNFTELYTLTLAARSYVL